MAESKIDIRLNLPGLDLLIQSLGRVRRQDFDINLDRSTDRSRKRGMERLDLLGPVFREHWRKGILGTGG